MHEKGILHRNLKPSKILIKDRIFVQICDFELSVQTDDLSFKTDHLIGTLGYTALELMDQSKSKPMNPEFIYNQETDIYSFGIMIGDLILSDFSWKKSQSNLNQFPIHSIEKVQKESKKRRIGGVGILFEKCTRRNPKERPTTNEILNDLIDIYFDLIDETPKEGNEKISKFESLQSRLKYDPEKRIEKVGILFEKCTRRNPEERPTTNQILNDLIDIYLDLIDETPKEGNEK